jgi:acetoin utilization deacetylase AcuC-like enzyme
MMADQKPTVAFISSPRFVEHDTGPHHPERPDRIRAIHRAVRAAGLIDSPDPFPDFELDLGKMPPAPFKLIEVEPAPADERWINLVHSPQYVQHVRRVAESGGGVLDQGDTRIGAQSYDIALLSLGGVLTACDWVMAAPNRRRAFTAGRPPGHHAEPDRPMGFCLFSNIAIGARYLQKKHGIQRIAIVDFDVHHGNGTQAVFDADPSVFFVSMHEDPRVCYPGSGYEWETGVGAGVGYTMNVPFPPRATDDDYLEALQRRILPVLDTFAPEVLMISAGFDAHLDDPLASVELSEAGFAGMTRQLVAFADRHCNGRIVSVLEGGYHLRALGRSVVQHLIALGPQSE